MNRIHVLLFATFTDICAKLMQSSIDITNMDITNYWLCRAPSKFIFGKYVTFTTYIECSGP